MLTDFSKHIKTRFPTLKNKKLLLAISGGVDSVVLTHLLHHLKFNISLAHCNFCLRTKASKNDEIFVQQLAKKLSLPIFIKSFNTKKFAKSEKLSIQLAARKLRYKWFYKLLKQKKIDYILTAHHSDDNIETFLINAIRGSGLEGLTGIPQKNNKILRLLLPFSKAQIQNYANKNNIKWQEDSTNIDTKYVRNKIRHKVIPALKEINPSLLKSLNKTINNLNDSRNIIDETINRLKKKIINSTKTKSQKIDINEIKKFNHPKAYLYYLLKDYGFTEWNNINNLINAQSGKQIFSPKYRIIKDRDFLLLEKLHSKKLKNKKYKIEKKDKYFKNKDLKLKLLDKNINNNFKMLKYKSPNTVYINKDLLEFPLLIRKWQNGDYFYPLGMQGKKKLSKYFKDEKISIIEKKKIYLLCSDKNIVWLIGKRLDDRFKVTNTTKNIIKIEIIK